MRILILSDVSGFMPGGVPAETRELIAGLARRGHEVAFAGDVPVTAAQARAPFPDHDSDRPLASPASRRDA